MKTPFFDKNGKRISVGDTLKDSEHSLMTVHFGEYIAGKDDWGINFVCYGFYIQWATDAGQYSLTQNGEGYCKKASELIKQ